MSNDSANAFTFFQHYSFLKNHLATQFAKTVVNNLDQKILESMCIDMLVKDYVDIDYLMEEIINHFGDFDDCEEFLKSCNIPADLMEECMSYFS